MLMQKRAMMLIAGAVLVVIALGIGISYSSVFGQQTDEAAKFQTLKGASLFVRHAYPDENQNGSFFALPSSVTLQNTKLEQTIQEAEKVWKMQEDFCSRNNCKVMELRPYELTIETELSQLELTNLISAVPISYSQQDTELTESGSELMTKYEQIFIKYNDQSYVVGIRSVWA